MRSSAPSPRLRTRLAQVAKQRHRDGLAEAEHAHGDTQDVVLEPIRGRARGELLAVERGGRSPPAAT